MKALLNVALAGLCATQSAFAESSPESMIMEALRCESAPSPTPLLRELAGAQMINLDKRIGLDLLSCWKFENEVVLSGLRFTSICANEIDEAVRAQNTDLYGDGANYVPLQALTLGSPETADQLVAWSKDALGAVDGNVLILGQDATSLGDTSELSCGVWVQ